MVGQWLFWVLLSVNPSASADVAPIPLFDLSKSENQNILHYEARVDQKCDFDSSQPFYIWWTLADGGGQEVLTGNNTDLKLFNLVSPPTVKNGNNERVVAVRAMSFSDTLRMIRVSLRGDSASNCTALPSMIIKGEPARLTQVALSDFNAARVPGVITLKGVSFNTGAAVEEALKISISLWTIPSIMGSDPNTWGGN